MEINQALTSIKQVCDKSVSQLQSLDDAAHLIDAFNTLVGLVNFVQQSQSASDAPAQDAAPASDASDTTDAPASDASDTTDAPASDASDTTDAPAQDAAPQESAS